MFFSASTQGQANSSQKPISGLSRFRYMEKGRASLLKRTLSMTLAPLKPGSICRARAMASSTNRAWPTSFCHRLARRTSKPAQSRAIRVGRASRPRLPLNRAKM
ncbi:hypothetical protein D3C76_1454020 [compost metagenome]